MNEFVPTHPTRPPTIGCLAAVNASLWCVVADADSGRGWKGGSGDDPDDPNDDFTRAMEFCEDPGGVIAIAGRQGVVCTVGGCGMSNIWRTPEGIALLEYYPEDDVDEDSADTWSAMASRAVDMLSAGSEHCGTVEVSSGCLVLMLPYVAADYSEADIARAAKSAGALRSADEDLVLVAMPDGRYDVWVDELEHEDELGMFEARLRIVRA